MEGEGKTKVVVRNCIRGGKSIFGMGMAEIAITGEKELKSGRMGRGVVHRRSRAEEGYGSNLRW